MSAAAGAQASAAAVTFPARDGYRLGGTLHRPHQPTRNAVVVHAAAGVPQAYYAGFAGYLAGRGHAVLTFDYRGIGASRPANLRGFKARMRDWAELDAAGALDFLEREAADARIAVVGHSFGGQCLGLVPGCERYRAGLLVAAQSGYWRHWSGAGRLGMWLLTHALLPSTANAFGYFPGRRLGQGEDLPAGVATEWAAWCRHPGYIVGALGAQDRYARIRAPLRQLWIEDDGYAPRAAAQALHAFYPASPPELVAVRPAALGLGRIGHFGFFRERFRATLWKDAADWLTETQ